MKYNLTDCINKLIPEITEQRIKKNGHFFISCTLPNDGVTYMNYYYALYCFDSPSEKKEVFKHVSELLNNMNIDIDLYQYNHYSIYTFFNMYTIITFYS